MLGIIDWLNDVVWGVPAMAVILGVGIMLSVRMRFFQITKLPHALKSTLGKAFGKSKSEPGSVTPMQALCTALAATLGTGSIAGVAGAISLGGPGAVFWMWVSALFGMCTKFTEVALSLRFRERNSKGDYVGGPMYFIKNGLGRKWMWLAYVFCTFTMVAVFGTGNSTQTNTIVMSIESSLKSVGIVADSARFDVIAGIAISLLTGLVLIGGIKRLGKVTETLVPAMALIFAVLAVGVVIIRIEYVPMAFKAIFEGAFNPQAVTGGAVGTMFMSLRKGVSRGIFSNEAGLGTASIAHAGSSETEPAVQGMFGIFEVFATTMVVCTLTALVVICGNMGVVPYGTEGGAELTLAGFSQTYGAWVTVPISFSIVCFAFSTILGWGLYGQRCIEFVLGERARLPFLVLFSLSCMLGATMDLGVIWKISDTANGLMAIPNLIAVALLSKEAVRIQRAYFSSGKDSGLKGKKKDF